MGVETNGANILNTLFIMKMGETEFSTNEYNTLLLHWCTDEFHYKIKAPFHSLDEIPKIAEKSYLLLVGSIYQGYNEMHGGIDECYVDYPFMEEDNLTKEVWKEFIEDSKPAKGIIVAWAYKKDVPRDWYCPSRLVKLI